MPRFARLFSPVVMAVLAAISAPAVAQPREVRIHSEWVFETDAAHPGDVIHAALKVRLEDHFHVQSNQPADEFSVPTALEITPPAGFTLREIVYPKSTPFAVEGFDEPLQVFDSEFVIGVALQAASDVAPGTHPLQAELHYQACNDKICLPPDSVKTQAQIKIVADDAPIAKTDNPIFNQITFSEDPEPIAPPDRTTKATPSTTAPSVDCDVLAELENFTVLGTAGGYLGVNDFIDFIDQAESGAAKKDLFEGMGPVLIVIVVILGGAALNLTPCVLPLIPINLAIIGAGVQAGSRRRGFALGGAYGLAMAIVYGALGLIVILTSSAFGTINSTIWFNVAIAILFVVLALAMFDVIAIDFTKYQSNIDATKVAKRGSLSLAFFMGCVTALLAGACVAPVVIQVIVYAGDQYAKWAQGQGGSPIALALPFFLGVGMALPWPFAGAGLSLLPKPGKWMNWVKKGMGVFILAFAAYYAYLAYGIWRIENLAKGEQTVALEGGWTADICAGLAQARAENKPVLIDMWATWCKSCFAMDKSTFKDEKVVARLDGFVKVKLQAEDIRNPTVERQVLEKFEGIGLPHYAVLRPKPAAQ